MDGMNHPFYCVWCGKILLDKETFEKHYDEELEEEELTEEQKFDLINNENHY